MSKKLMGHICTSDLFSYANLFLNISIRENFSSLSSVLFCIKEVTVSLSDTVNSMYLHRISLKGRNDLSCVASPHRS